MSLKRIAKGEEVLVFYGYSPNSFVSSWYAKAYEGSKVMFTFKTFMRENLTCTQVNDLGLAERAEECVA